MTRLVALLILFLSFASPANALEIVGFLTAGGTLSGITATLGLRLLATVALSALAQAMQPKPKEPGIRTQYPTQGGTNPASFILGHYATEGNRVCPNYSFGAAGNTPNAYLVTIRDYGDLPGQALSRVMINKEYVTLDTTPHADLGYPVLEYRAGGADYAWVKYYDGSQTVADAFLLSQFGADPDFPWSTDMVGTGVAYAIFTFRYNRNRFTGEPSIRCEFDGIPLYDPRLDTTVGGSGSHRWATPSTWETTTNPQVMKYNILRGIALPDGSVWGGETEADDLPLDNWFAAMNECDVVADGESAAQYRAGIEVSVDQEPADIIDELDKACSGQTFESGGIWKTRTGPVGLPVYFFTDDDIIITDEQELDPFPALEATFNGIQATHPDPDSLWNPKEAPPRWNATWEAADQNRRLIANVQFSAVPWADQVQRLMEAYINEERRFRRHSLVLPPDAAILEPLDAVSWTSTRNGYTAKVFEMSRSADDQVSCNQAIALRERDSADYSWVSGSMLPTAASGTGRTLPVAQSVPGWAVSKAEIEDASAVSRRPAIRLDWSAPLDDVRGIRWQVRVKATAAEVSTGSTLDVDEGGVLISSGILGATEYEVRGRLVVDRASEWTAWTSVTTDDVRLDYADFVSQIATDIANAAKVPVVATLPADDTTYGAVVFLTSDASLYRWDGVSAWTREVAASTIIGTLVAGQIGAGIIGATHMASDTLSAIFANIGTMTSGAAGDDRVVITDGLITVIDGDGASGSGDVTRLKIGILS